MLLRLVDLAGLLHFFLLFVSAMPSFLSTRALLLCAAAASAVPPLPPPGAGAWTYDVKGGQPAEWSSDIAAFNARAHLPLSLIFSYGGDMECELV